MIFYLTAGQLVGTQADARAIDPKFTQIDVPTDKPGLMAYVNSLLSKDISYSDPLPDPIRSFPDLEPVDVPRAPESEALSSLLNPALLQAQVEALGEKMEAGFNVIEQHQSLTGVGAAFSRGVHVLNIVAAGEHQLMRVLKGKKK